MAVFDGGVFDVGAFDVEAVGDAAANGATLTATIALIAGTAAGAATTDADRVDTASERFAIMDADVPSAPALGPPSDAAQRLHGVWLYGRVIADAIGVSVTLTAGTAAGDASAGAFVAAIDTASERFAIMDADVPSSPGLGPPSSAVPRLHGLWLYGRVVSEAITATATLVAGQASSNDAYANGVTLTATTSLIAGVAAGDPVQVPEPVFEDIGVSGGRRPLFEQANAQAPGATIWVTASLIPGAVVATQQALVAPRTLYRVIELHPGNGTGEAQTPATAAITRATLASGEATGFDAIKHDNEFLLMAA